MARAGKSEGVQILELRGLLTSSTAPQLQEAVAAASGRGLIIDLSGVTHVDSSAIGGLIRAYVSCQKAARRLALAGASRRVLNVLSITGVEPLFESFATAGEAEAAFG